MKKYIFIIVFSFALFSGSIGIAGPGLIISEVLYNEPGSSVLGEWFEIFNPTLNAIDLTSYYIEDASGGQNFFPASSLIQSGETLVIARNATTFQSQNGFLPDFDYLSLTLNNGGDFIKLFDPLDNLIDFVAWENGITGWGLTAGDNESIIRIANPTAPTSWLSNQTPTPGATGLTTIPEPNTLILLGFGLLVLGVIGKHNFVQGGKLKSHPVEKQSGNNPVSRRR